MIHGKKKMLYVEKTNFVLPLKYRTLYVQFLMTHLIHEQTIFGSVCWSVLVFCPPLAVLPVLIRLLYKRTGFG